MTTRGSKAAVQPRTKETYFRVDDMKLSRLTLIIFECPLSHSARHFELRLRLQ